MQSSGWITSPSGGNVPGDKLLNISSSCHASFSLMNNLTSLSRGHPAQLHPGQSLLQALLSIKWYGLFVLRIGKGGRLSF